MVKIDPRSSVPIYEQLVENIKEHVLRGVFKADEKIPSVRDMAKMLTLNPNTVQKAYQELERQRVIYTVRGRGAFISSEYGNRIDEERVEKLKKVVKRAIVEAHYLGLSEKNFHDLVKKIYEELEEGHID